MVSAFYVAPVTHFWFKYLDRALSAWKGSQVSKALAMVAIDQTVGAVVVTTGFFCAFSLVQKVVPGHSKPDNRNIFTIAYESVSQNLWPTLLANWSTCLKISSRNHG